MCSSDALLNSGFVNEWESWLQRLASDDVAWDDNDAVMFVTGVLLLSLPKRWMQEMQSAAMSKTLH